MVRITDILNMTIAVDWDVKPQNKQTKQKHLDMSVQIFRIITAFMICWSFTAQSTTRSCRAGQLIVALFLGRLRPSKRGRPRQ